jgi:hypothetical protein
MFMRNLGLKDIMLTSMEGSGPAAYRWGRLQLMEYLQPMGLD